MAQKVLERDVEMLLKNLLDKEGIFHFKGNPMNLKGYPDRMVFADEIYFVEVKVGKQGGSYYKQTPTQKYWEGMIKKSKGNYVLLTGKEEVKDFVSKLKKALIK